MSTTRAARWSRPATTALAALALVLGPSALAPPHGGAHAAGTSPSPAAPSPTATTQPQVVEEAVTLELTDLAPAYALPGDTLVLTGTLTNTTDEDFADPTLRIDVQQSVPTSRIPMERWFDPETGPRGRTVVTADYGVTVPPGGTAPFSFSVPVVDLGFPIRFDNWGARGLQVSLTSGGETATARTMGVFHPGEPVTEPNLGLSLLLPLTPSAREWTTAIETGVGVDEVAGDRIREVVAATGPDASWALDPALLEPTGRTEETDPDAAAATGDDGASNDADGTDGADAAPGTDGAPAVDPTETADPADPDPTDAADPADPTSPADPAPSLQDDLVAAAGDRSVVALPRADADIPALAGAGADGRTLLTDARTAALEVFAESGLQVGTTTAWPAAPGVSQESLALATRAGYTAVVLDGVAEADESLTATPSSRVDVTGEAATLTALVSEPRLSGAVAGEAPEGSGTMTEELASRQYALALSAVMTRESQTARTLLVTADREVVGDAGAGVDVAALGSRVTTLLDAPWVTPVGLADAMAGAPDDATRSALPASDDVTTQPFLRATEAVLAGHAESADLRSALERPDALDAVDDVLDTAISTAWRLDGTSPAVATSAAARALAPDSTAVTIDVPASLVDLLAESSAVPLTLTNTLAQRVTVDVRVVPEQPALRVEDVDPVTIEPGDSVRVPVPMVAVANGRTRVDVTVASPDGAVIGTVKTFDLRVRAEWETVGTGIVAAALGLLLVVGLVRTFRRGRRNRDGHVPGTEPDGGAPDRPDDPDGPDDPDDPGDPSTAPVTAPDTDAPAPPTKATT